MIKPGFAATLCMIVLIGLLWGLNWPAVKFMLTEVSPLTLRAASFTAGAIALTCIAAGMGQRLIPTRSEVRPLIVTSLFILFGFNMLTVLGQLFTPASKAAIIAYSMPAMTAALSVAFLGEVLDMRRVLAICVGLAGLGILASADLPALVAAPLGPVIMLGAALSWAIGNILMQVQNWTLPPLARSAWIFIISAALAWPLVAVFEPTTEAPALSAAVLWTFAFHVCGPMVACYVMWTVLLGRLSATVAAISTLIAPVVGVLSSVVLLSEPLTWQTTVALLLIVGSIAMTLLRPISKHLIP